MKLIIYKRMHDPIVGKTWLQPFKIKAKSPAELKRKLIKLSAQHVLWNGEVPRG